MADVIDLLEFRDRIKRAAAFNDTSELFRIVAETLEHQQAILRSHQERIAKLENRDKDNG